MNIDRLTRLAFFKYELTVSLNSCLSDSYILNRPRKKNKEIFKLSCDLDSFLAGVLNFPYFFLKICEI